jgi:hypothetical protein
MKKEKVNVKQPIYAKDKTLTRFRKLKGNATSDYLLNILMDSFQEVNRRK